MDFLSLQVEEHAEAHIVRRPFQSVDQLSEQHLVPLDRLPHCFVELLEALFVRFVAGAADVLDVDCLESSRIHYVF